MLPLAFITDLDGTLCDVLPANVAAYSEAFTLAGYDFDETAYREHFGYRFDEMMDLIAPHIPAKHRNIIASHKSAAYEKNLASIVPNTPLIHFLRYAKKSGAKIGLCTTAKKVNATNVLRYLGIENLFDVIIFGEDVTKSKPDPECYVLAIKKLHAKPADSVIFEDTDIGMQAAIQAGAHAIKVKI
ncbi:MAG: HAD family phosphatase [Candidatus Saccharimonadales bacterium]|jgi:beta-phosphoglucomutase